MAIVVNRFRKREGVKKFFAFVEVSDHLEAINKNKKKRWILTLADPTQPTKGGEIHLFFFIWRLPLVGGYMKNYYFYTLNGI